MTECWSYLCSGKGGVDLLQHDHDVLALAFRPDGKLLASATLDAAILFWDPAEGELQVLANPWRSPTPWAYLHSAEPRRQMHALPCCCLLLAWPEAWGVAVRVLVPVDPVAKSIQS